MIQRKKTLLTLMTMLLSTAAWSEVGGTFTSALTVNGNSVDVTYTILTEGGSEGNTCMVQGTYNKTTKKYKAAIATTTECLFLISLDSFHRVKLNCLSTLFNSY